MGHIRKFDDLKALIQAALKQTDGQATISVITTAGKNTDIRVVMGPATFAISLDDADSVNNGDSITFDVATGDVISIGRDRTDTQAKPSPAKRKEPSSSSVRNPKFI